MNNKKKKKSNSTPTKNSSENQKSKTKFTEKIVKGLKEGLKKKGKGEIKNNLKIMAQKDAQLSLKGRHKRVSKYLGVSQKKARRLLIKHNRSSIRLKNPEDLRAREKALCQLIKREENLNSSDKFTF